MATRENRDIHLRVPATCRPKAAKDRVAFEITESIEEYTEGVYRLQEEMEVVSTGDIAKYMSVAPASVTMMLKKMSELGLVDHTPYQGVKLTAKGDDLSVKLLRKHRLVERLLVDFLQLPWDDVHDLACKLEHYLSEDVADNIAKALNFPKTCPHGNPVDATFKDGSHRLSDAESGDRLIVAKVSDERMEFLSYIMEIGLIPEASIRVKSRTPFGDVMTLEVEGYDSPVSIGHEVSRSVWVFSNRKSD